jgi:hypothetical protein
MIAVERPSAALMQKVHEPLGVVTLPSLPALAAPALPFPGYEVGIPCAAMC